ncbi:hypothetical protein CK203_008384 [Vitis vinifera]|uniref:Uncharacterized protein n=1 Tax=Vitis vinifera TaxID=29760 RepID=A0A438KNS3_VITVI|nr:hypothetical protein CK203_008384 [Vitis vinifera]
MDTLPMDKKNAISDMGFRDLMQLSCTPNRTYDIKILEANLLDLPIGEEFMKSFLIFTCATILAPNSKQKSISDAWTDEQVKRRLATEIHTYGNYGHVQEANLLYIMMEYIQAGSSHSDDPTESKFRTSYEPPSSVAQDIATLHARSNGGQSGCAFTPPKEVVNVERKKDEGSTGVHPCSDEMMGKGTGAQALILASKESRCSSR